MSAKSWLHTLVAIFCAFSSGLQVARGHALMAAVLALFIWLNLIFIPRGELR